MRLLLAAARYRLGLPAPRCRTAQTTQWTALSDGTRLATLVVRPVDRMQPRAPSVLVRTAHAVDAPALRLSAHLVAQQGYAVVVQSCRGRSRSEGRFEPFVHEARDGAEAVEWVARQAWFDGRLALAGAGYAGYAAWAACAAEAVSAVVVGFAARDPYAWLHAGGALRLDLALQLSVGLGESEFVAPQRLDLARAVRHRPVREADRVALRRSDAYRSWIDHPERDAFWDALCPALPPRSAPTLIIAGWHEPALLAQLADHAALGAVSQLRGGAPPELVIGPWAPHRRARGWREREDASSPASALRAVLSFLDRHLRGSSESSAPVRVYVRGARRWREAPAWPPPGAEERSFHLCGEARGHDSARGGCLAERPPEGEEPPDRFVYDPADAVPSCGVAALCAPAGTHDPREIARRGDVLCYTSEPLLADLEIAGPVRAVLFAASDAPDTDFTAKLVEVAEDGSITHLCEGIVRCRARAAGVWLAPDRVERLEIDLGATSCKLRAGQRLRVEISSSSFPRFDRNPNTRAEPARATEADLATARQRVFHDAQRPSQITLHVLPC